MEEFYAWLCELRDEAWANGESVLDIDATTFDRGYVSGYRDALDLVQSIIEDQYL